MQFKQNLKSIREANEAAPEKMPESTKSLINEMLFMTMPPSKETS